MESSGSSFNSVLGSGFLISLTVGKLIYERVSACTVGVRKHNCMAKMHVLAPSLTLRGEIRVRKR